MSHQEEDLRVTYGFLEGPLTVGRPSLQLHVLPNAPRHGERVHTSGSERNDP